MMTVRDRIHAIQRKLLDHPDVVPSNAREMLMELGALLGNCNTEIRLADAEYASILLGHLESAEKANRAKIRAEITPEYARKQEARNTKELAVELMRNLKVYLKSLEEEMRLAR